MFTLKWLEPNRCEQQMDPKTKNFDNFCEEFLEEIYEPSKLS